MSFKHLQMVSSGLHLVYLIWNITVIIFDSLAPSFLLFEWNVSPSLEINQTNLSEICSTMTKCFEFSGSLHTNVIVLCELLEFPTWPIVFR